MGSSINIEQDFIKLENSRLYKRSIPKKKKKIGV